MKKIATVTWIMLGVVLFGNGRANAISYFYSMPYRGSLDSPFLQGIREGTIYLETFEDRQANSPYMTAWNGGISESGSFTNVDEDDGQVDGSRYGFTWTRGGSLGGQFKFPRGLHFDFSPNAEGNLPEYAGAVLFGAMSQSTTGMIYYNNMLVFDANGEEVTLGGWKVPIPETTIPGTTGESGAYDRFLGVYLPGGISRIVFSDAGVIDHLQYGYAIPEPSAATLAMALLLGAGALTRRRR